MTEKRMKKLTTATKGQKFNIPDFQSKPNQDYINKMNCLIGYLEYFTNKRSDIENSADEITAVIKEAKEWSENLIV